MPEIDFPLIASTALVNAESVVSYLMPDGRREGVEWSAINPTRPDQTRGSFKVNLATGVWSDFATGDKGGDLIDLWAYVRRCSNGEAAVELREFLNLPDAAPARAHSNHGHNRQRNAPRKPQDKNDWSPVLPIPETAPEPPQAHPTHGKPSYRWAYNGPDGRLWGYNCRFDKGGDKGGEEEAVQGTDSAAGAKEFSQQTYCRSASTGAMRWKWKSFDKPRPMYGLERLAANPGAQVLVVEGEKCADAGQSALPGTVVASWIGGAPAVDGIDWSPLAGRKVVLWPDNDRPGRKAMAGVLSRIAPTAAGVRMLRVPDGKPDGWDIADAITEGMTADDLKAFIKANLVDPMDPAALPLEEEPPPIDVSALHDYAPPLPEPSDLPDNGAASQSASSGALPPPLCGPGPFANAPFKCLGYDHGVFFYFPHASGQVIELSADRHTKNNLIALAPLQWWESHFAGEKGISWTAAVNALMQMCVRAGVYDADKIRWCGAWYDRGRVVQHLGNMLIVDGTPTEIRAFDTQYIYEVAPATEISCEKPLERKEAYKLIEIFQMCPVQTGLDARLLAGWCVIAPICGALYWRPHIWITGRKGTGKSWIISQIIRPILGKAALEVSAGATEAGIRQDLGQHAFPVLYDEGEGKDRTSRAKMDMVIELMRGTSSESGAKIIKGGQDGRARKYRIRSCFCLGSITIPIQYSADESRITIISLTPKHENIRKQAFDMLEADVNSIMAPKWCSMFRARSIKMIPVIYQNAIIFAKAIAEKLANRRLGDQMGTLLAGAYTLYSNSVVDISTAGEWVEKQNWTEQIESEKESDELRCLYTILQKVISTIEDGKRVDRSIVELVRESLAPDDEMGFSNSKRDEAHRTLLRCGIRVRDSVIIIANSHIGIKEMLTGSEFERNWGKLLERLDGAERTNPVRFIDGINSRAVSIPLNLIFGEEKEL